METFEQAIGAGSYVHFPGGKRFYLLDTTYPVDLTFYGLNNKIIGTSGKFA